MDLGTSLRHLTPMRPLPLLTLLLTLAFAGSAFVTSFDGFDGAQLPIPQADPPGQPPGWAFAIWGPIYAGLVASAVFGLWRRAADAGWDRARAPLIVSLALGTPWMWVAERSAIAACVMIVVMAAAAILALLRAPRRDRLLLVEPLGLYAGWLTAASFVALGSTALGYGIGPGPEGWAVIGILGTLAVVVPVLLRRRDAAGYALALAWALLALVIKDGDAQTWVTPLGEGGIVLMVALAWKGALLPSSV